MILSPEQRILREIKLISGRPFNMTNEEAAKMLFAVVGILRGYEMTMGIRLEDMETTEVKPCS